VFSDLDEHDRALIRRHMKRAGVLAGIAAVLGVVVGLLAG